MRLKTALLTVTAEVSYTEVSGGVVSGWWCGEWVVGGEWMVVW